MNARARLSSKGQIVVPKSVRDSHGWKEGMEFEFVDSGKGVTIQPVQESDPRFPPVTTSEFMARRIKYKGPPVSLKEMKEAVLEEAARRWDEKDH